MHPHPSNILNWENIEVYSPMKFLLSQKSEQTNVSESEIDKHKIIVIHGRKYDVTNFNHPGK